MDVDELIIEYSITGSIPFPFFFVEKKLVFEKNNQRCPKAPNLSGGGLSTLWKIP